MNTLIMMASIVHCYAGCGAGSSDLQALHVLACDTETGLAKVVQSVKGVQGTTYFQLDGKGRNLYSVIGEKRDGKKVGSVVRFPVAADGRLGEMERLAVLPCEAPCHVSLTPDGKRVAFAAYSSATVGTVGIDGKDLKTYVFPNDAMGPNKRRQQKAYAHFSFMTPDAKRLGFIDLGCDRIRFFDPETLVPDLAMDIRFDPGDGPRHAVWSNDGRFLFVVNELGSSVTSFALAEIKQSDNQTVKRFSRVGKWSMLPADFSCWDLDGVTLASKASAIRLTADGKILMASNRGHESIAFYDVGADGTLKLRNIAKLTGRFPRDFALMPGEKFMVVGHETSNDMQVYRFDRAACTLTPVGAPIAAWHPLCFAFGK